MGLFGDVLKAVTGAPGEVSGFFSGLVPDRPRPVDTAAIMRKARTGAPLTRDEAEAAYRAGLNISYSTGKMRLGVDYTPAAEKQTGQRVKFGAFNAEELVRSPAAKAGIIDVGALHRPEGAPLPVLEKLLGERLSTLPFVASMGVTGPTGAVGRTGLIRGAGIIAGGFAGARGTGLAAREVIGPEAEPWGEMAGLFGGAMAGGAITGRLTKVPTARALTESAVGLDIDPAEATAAAIARQGGRPMSDLNVPLREIVGDPLAVMDNIMAQEATRARLLSWWPFRPFRAITNRFVGPANTVKANHPDAFVSLETGKLEDFALHMDEVGMRLDEGIAARHPKWKGAKYWTDEIELASGQKAPIGDVFENPSKFKLTRAELASIDAGPNIIREAHLHAKERLISYYVDDLKLSLYEATARASKVLPETPLEGTQRYWPRIQAAIGEEEFTAGRPFLLRAGQAPNIDMPRAMLEVQAGLRQFHGSPGTIVSRYTQQLMYKLQHEMVVEPWRIRRAFPRSKLIPVEIQAAADQAVVRRDWLKKANQLLKEAPGLGPGQLTRRLGTLLAKDVPEEYKLSLGRLEVPSILEAPPSREVVRRARVAAGEAARTFEPPGPARARLGKAAEARIAVEAAETARTRLKREIALIRKELKNLTAINADEVATTRQTLKAVKRSAVQGMRPLREQVRRALGGSADELFENTIARQMEQSVERLLPENMPGFLRAINDLSGILVGLMAGTTEFGHAFLQMLIHMGSCPLIFPRTMLRAFANRPYMNRMAVLQGLKDRAGRSYADMLKGGGLRHVSEPTMPDIAVVGSGVLPKIARLVSRWPVNRHFTRAVNLAREETAIKYAQTWERVVGRVLTEEEYALLARRHNSITGDFQWTKGGFGLVQRGIERGVGRFAATWLRSNLDVIAAAAHPSAGLEANIARAHLATVLGTLTVIYSGLSLSMGQTPHLNPLKPKEFFSFRIPGTDTRVRPGGIFLGLIRTFGRTYELAEKAAKGDKKAQRALVDIREGRNPLHQYWRGGAPVIGALMHDLVLEDGRMAFSEKQLAIPESPEQLLESAQALGYAVAPFTVQSALQEGPAGAISTFLGWNAIPIRPPELFMEQADEKAAKMGFRRWEDVPKATQADMLRKDGELQKAFDARTAYYERFPDRQRREEWVYEEIESSRKLVEDSMLPMWQGVEAGTRSVSEWRRAFSEQMGYHAYHSSRLMDALDTDLKRRDSETLQDYYGRVYHAIQPESFDGLAFVGDFPDGVLSPAEWELWREKRTAFWQEFPEALQFRSYIETEYPTRNWESSEMVALHQMKIQMNQAYQEFLDIPKYRGLSAEAAVFIDSVRGLADRKAREIRFMLAQRGVDVSKVRVPARLAWELVLRDIAAAGLSANQIEWLKIAILMDLKPQARRKLMSPERARYLLDHRDMPLWYPSAYEDAGLGDREIAMLGLAQAPLGTSVPERIAAATV